MTMQTNRDITKEFPSHSKMKITVPKGTKVKFIEGGGYAVDDDKALLKAGAWGHDINHHYFYVPDDAVSGRLANAQLLRPPLTGKSDDWRETAFHWLVDINGQKFDFYTGSAHVDKRGKPAKPKLDDVLHSLVMDADACDMSFSEWCSNLGYDEDSRKALDIYIQCQKSADKLRKAGVNIAAERERLQDY